MIHIDGPGRFYLAGPNAEFVDLGCSNMCMQDMVQMSPLQGSFSKSSAPATTSR